VTLDSHIRWRLFLEVSTAGLRPVHLKARTLLFDATNHSSQASSVTFRDMPAEPSELIAQRIEVSAEIIATATDLVPAQLCALDTK